MYASACEGAEKYRKRGHKCLAFTGSHLGYFTLMQYNAAY